MLIFKDNTVSDDDKTNNTPFTGKKMRKMGKGHAHFSKTIPYQTIKPIILGSRDQTKQNQMPKNKK